MLQCSKPDEDQLSPLTSERKTGGLRTNITEASEEQLRQKMQRFLSPSVASTEEASEVEAGLSRFERTNFVQRQERASTFNVQKRALNFAASPRGVSNFSELGQLISTEQERAVIRKRLNRQP